jgi:LysR family transcriptional regulator (chromosome initiation inhibitor)
MIDYRQIQALAIVIEEQNFERAAARLHVTQSAISQRIKQLEEQIGQSLLVRSHPLTPTEAGQTLLKHYRQVELLQTHLMEELTPNEVGGFTRLSIGLNADTLATWFLSALEPLLKEYSLLLDLKVDDQDQTLQLLKQGDVMGCITATEKPLQGCNSIPLGVCVYRAFASPEFMKRYFPDGVDRASIKQAPIVEYNHKDALQIRYLRTFFHLEPSEYQCHRIPAAEPFVDLIQRGFGVGMIPDQMADPLVAQGQLVDISPGQFLAVPLYWHVWSLKTPLAKQLSEALVSAASRELAPFDQYPDLYRPKLTR